MTVISAVSRSLRPILGFLQPLVLAGLTAVTAAPARATDDCSSFAGEACLREWISSDGTWRALNVSVLRQNKNTDYFNVILPGSGQRKVEPGAGFQVIIPGDGKVVYSIEACDHISVTQTYCTPWKQITRNFGPVAQAQPCPSGYVWRDNFDGDTLCVKPEQRHKLADGTCRSGYVWRDSFNGDAVCVTPAERAAAKASASAAAGGTCANQGLVSVGGSPGCYCPGSLVNSGTGLPRADSINQCVTPQAYNAAKPCGSGGLVAVGGSPGCYCPKSMVNSGTGLPRADSINQCVTPQAYNAAHPNGQGGGGGGGGGGTQTATAPNGTTIYKQPNGDDRQTNVAGYVNPGGKVTIVSCNGNFCNISAPRAGWVWHEDIGR